MAWTRLHTVHNTGGLGIAGRTYGLNGEPYPRITISLYRSKMRAADNKEEGLEVSVNMKRDEESWWNRCPVPMALLDEIPQIVAEAKEHLAGGKDNGHLDPEDED